MSLRSILVSPEIQNFTGTNSQLYRKVVGLAKAQVGHGISAEYFNSRFGVDGTISPEMLKNMVKAAPFWKGCFNKKKMALGLKHFRQRKALAKKQQAEKEKI